MDFNLWKKLQQIMNVADPIKKEWCCTCSHCVKERMHNKLQWWVSVQLMLWTTEQISTAVGRCTLHTTTKWLQDTSPSKGKTGVGHQWNWKTTKSQHTNDWNAMMKMMDVFWMVRKFQNPIQCKHWWTSWIMTCPSQMSHQLSWKDKILASASKSFIVSSIT